MIVFIVIVRKRKKKKKYAEEYKARIARENAQRQKAAEEAEKRKAEEEERKRQEAERQKAAAARARQEALDSGKLSREDETGKLLFASFNPMVAPIFLMEVEELAGRNWQAAFCLWLMHYIGMGVEADAVELKDLPGYLETGLFQKVMDLAPENERKQLAVFASYLGTGINFMHEAGQDSPELIRMRGLFHAVTISDLIGTTALLFADTKEEAAFWNNVFAHFPGVAEDNELELTMCGYFMSYFDPQAKLTVIRDVQSLLAQLKNREATPDRAELLLYAIARDSIHKSGPCSTVTATIYNLVSGMTRGNAACTYLLAGYLTAQDTRQQLYEYCKSRKQNLEWIINGIKTFLGGLDEKGDPKASNWLKILESDTTRCQGELEDAMKN